MTAVEGRLRAMAHALAESVPDASIPPLRLPPARRHVRPPAWFVPLAAAAAMALIAGLIWTGSVTRARIIQGRSTTVTAASGSSQASGHPAGRSHRSAGLPPASVAPPLAGSRYSLLPVAGIKGPGQRNLLGLVLATLAATAADSVTVSAGSSCAQGIAIRQDVCTVGA